MRVQSASLALATLLVAVSTTHARKARAAAACAVPHSLKPSMDLECAAPTPQDDNHEIVSLLQCKDSLPLVSTRGGETSAFVQDLLGRLKIASYFALWYALNIVYNSTSSNLQR